MTASATQVLDREQRFRDLVVVRSLFAPARWIWPDTLPSPVPHLPPGRSEQPAILQRR